MAGATRQGGAVSEQGAGGAELPQLREGAAAEWQEALLVWHERILAAVFLEEGEWPIEGCRGTGEDLAMTALSISSTSCEIVTSSRFMSGNISSRTKDCRKSSLIRINGGLSGLMKQMIALKDKNLESK
jgi:hypothetical protein